MSEHEGMRVIGIDPASGKGLDRYERGTHWGQRIRPGDARAWVRSQLSADAPPLFTWDAPISFDAKFGLTERPLEASDSPMQKWLARQCADGKLAHRAVFVGGFAGLSHWAISCECLGMPFGDTPDGLRIAGTVEQMRSSSGGQGFVIEVHPAVSMAVWWVALDCRGPFPRYKGNSGKGAAQHNRDAQRIIWDELGTRGLVEEGTPVPASDDQLDAWVSWRMGVDFLVGKACWVGNPSVGGFVLPLAAEERFGLRTAMEKYMMGRPG